MLSVKTMSDFDDSFDHAYLHEKEDGDEDLNFTSFDAFDSLLIAIEFKRSFFNRDLYVEYRNINRKLHAMGPIRVKTFKGDHVEEKIFESISDLLDYEDKLRKHTIKRMPDGTVAIVIKDDETDGKK